MVSPGSYKKEQDGCGVPQERLINGCCDVLKGKVAAWGEGRLMKMDAAGPRRFSQSSYCASGILDPK